MRSIGASHGGNGLHRVDGAGLHGAAVLVSRGVDRWAVFESFLATE